MFKSKITQQAIERMKRMRSSEVREATIRMAKLDKERRRKELADKK